MRGLADSQTLTGRVQRVLSDEWMTQADIHWHARLNSVKSSTLTALLERLVREGRAERRQVSLPPALSMQGYRVEWRAPQAVTEKDHVIGDDTISIDYAKEER